MPPRSTRAATPVVPTTEAEDGITNTNPAAVFRAVP
jgi:hypothetical protein